MQKVNIHTLRQLVSKYSELEGLRSGPHSEGGGLVIGVDIPDATQVKKMEKYIQREGLSMTLVECWRKNGDQLAKENLAKNRTRGKKTLGSVDELAPAKLPHLSSGVPPKLDHGTVVVSEKKRNEGGKQIESTPPRSKSAPNKDGSRATRQSLSRATSKERTRSISSASFYFEGKPTKEILRPSSAPNPSRKVGYV